MEESNKIDIINKRIDYYEMLYKAWCKKIESNLRILKINVDHEILGIIKFIIKTKKSKNINLDNNKLVNDENEIDNKNLIIYKKLLYTDIEKINNKIKKFNELFILTNERIEILEKKEKYNYITIIYLFFFNVVLLFFFFIKIYYI